MSNKKSGGVPDQMSQLLGAKRGPRGSRGKPVSFGKLSPANDKASEATSQPNSKTTNTTSKDKAKPAPKSSAAKSGDTAKTGVKNKPVVPKATPTSTGAPPIDSQATPIAQKTTPTTTVTTDSSGASRHMIKSTLPVWLWIWHVQKKRMNSISKTSSVNFTVSVEEDEKVLVEVYPVGPQISPTTLPEAAKSVQSILTEGKHDWPVVVDVTGYELEAEEHVATNQTGCFICQSPDDRPVLVGPFKKILEVYPLIFPNADIDLVAKEMARRIGYKAPPKPKTPPPPPTLSPPPRAKPSDGEWSILPTKNTKEGVLVDKYLWMFMKHCLMDKIKKTISPYKTKEYTADSDYTIVNLVPNNSGTTKVQKRLFDLVHEYERKCKHHVITVKDPVHQKQVDEVAKKVEMCLIVREEALTHIVTLGEKMDEMKQIIYDILAGKYAQDDGKDGGDDDAKAKEKYARKLNFKWGGKNDITIFEGNVTNLRVDAIVNPANSALHNSDGISKAISRGAGPELDQECKMRVANRGRIQVTKNYVSQSYHLPCKSIIHMVGPMWKSYDDKAKGEKHLYQTFVNCLKEASSKKFKTLGFPVDSSVLWGVPLDMIIKNLTQAVTDHFKQNPKSSISGLSIVDFNKVALAKIQHEFTSRIDETLVLIT